MRTVEYNSAVKKNAILPFSTRMELEGVMLHEVSQTEKDNYHVISFIRGIKNKTHEKQKHK